MKQCEHCYERFKSEKNICPRCGGKLIELADFYDPETGEHEMTDGERRRFFPRTALDIALAVMLWGEGTLLMVNALLSFYGLYAFLALFPALAGAGVWAKDSFFDMGFSARVINGENVIEGERPDLAKIQAAASRHNFMARLTGIAFAAVFGVAALVSFGGAPE